MAKSKTLNKFIKVSVIVVVCLIALNILLSGINVVPFKYRNKAVSFLTPDLTWDSKPSDVMLKYGLPKAIGNVNDITGERNFDFDFVYDDKDVSLNVCNRAFLNSEIHSYSYTIDCKTSERASESFDECHKSMMDLYKDEPDFRFDGTVINTEYSYADGTPCETVVLNQDGVEQVFIIDDNENEIPIVKVDDVIHIKTKNNEYNMFDTVGVNYCLSYSEGESTVTLCADVLY